MSNKSWDDLIRRLSDSGDQDTAWTELLERIRGMARLLVQSEYIDDVVSSVSLKLAGSGLDRMRAARSPEGYVFMIVKNASIDLLRSVARESRNISLDAHGVPETLAFQVPPVEPRLVRALEELNTAISELPGPDRQLLDFRFREDLPIGEIAHRLNLPYSTVAKRLIRLTNRLRSRLRLEQ